MRHAPGGALSASAGGRPERLIFAAACLCAALAVILGAFGAHTLRGRLSPDRLAVFETGVRYHLIHSLALLAAAGARIRWSGRRPVWAAAGFAGGIVLFSGSLYLLALGAPRALGAITPIGGLGFIAGWIALALSPHPGRDSSGHRKGV